MDIRTNYRFFRELKKDTLSFVYQGVINDEFTEKIMSMTSQNLSNEKEDTVIRKRLAFLVAESFQNIVRYADPPKESVNLTQKKSIFLLRESGNFYFVISANIIDKKTKDVISKKLTGLNNLSQEELKALYLDILSNQSFSEKGGAGLGMIEMARKTGQKLDFHFEKISEEFYLFYFQLKLSKGGKQNAASSCVTLSLSDSILLHSLMAENHLQMIFKGDLSSDSIQPVLNIIERNIDTSDELYNLKKIMHHFLSELLRNVAKHSYSKNKRAHGILSIAEEEGKHIISTGNYILNTQVPALKLYLDKLNATNKDELNLTYYKHLKNWDQIETDFYGFGLIDIARNTQVKISYDFVEADEELSFFTISIIY